MDYFQARYGGTLLLDEQFTPQCSSSIVEQILLFSVLIRHLSTLITTVEFISLLYWLFDNADCLKLLDSLSSFIIRHQTRIGFEAIRLGIDRDDDVFSWLPRSKISKTIWRSLLSCMYSLRVIDWETRTCNQGPQVQTSHKILSNLVTILQIIQSSKWKTSAFLFLLLFQSYSSALQPWLVQMMRVPPGKENALIRMLRGQPKRIRTAPLGNSSSAALGSISMRTRTENSIATS